MCSLDRLTSNWVGEARGLLTQVQGSYNIVRLLQQLKPKVVVPLINGAFPSRGTISYLLKEIESADSLSQRLQDANVKGVQVQMPAPVTQAMTINL